MAKELTPQQQLDNVTDMLVQDILEMSDEELRAECIEAGLDPDKEAGKVAAIIDKAIKKTRGQNDG